MDLINLFTTLDAAATCTAIPEQITGLLGVLVTIIQVVVPIGLVIWGMLDLGKAVFQQKEEDIKKAQMLFLKRIVAAILVFLTVAIITFIVQVLQNANVIDPAVGTCIEQIFS